MAQDDKTTLIPDTINWLKKIGSKSDKYTMKIAWLNEIGWMRPFCLDMFSPTTLVALWQSRPRKTFLTSSPRGRLLHTLYSICIIQSIDHFKWVELGHCTWSLKPRIILKQDTMLWIQMYFHDENGTLIWETPHKIRHFLINNFF